MVDVDDVAVVVEVFSFDVLSVGLAEIRCVLVSTIVFLNTTVDTLLIVVVILLVVVSGTIRSVKSGSFVTVTVCSS